MARRPLSQEGFSEMYGDIPNVCHLVELAQDEEISKAANQKLWNQTPDGTDRYIVDLSMRLGILGVSDINIGLLAGIAEDQALARYQHDRERSAHD